MKVYGTGRRKSAIARVWLSAGEGNITVNNKNAKDYFCRDTLDILINRPLKTLGINEQYNVNATVKGGGISGQAGALQLGISRAILNIDEEFRKQLRAGGFLTRDSRVKERKKYGRKKARRGFQFVKR